MSTSAASTASIAEPLYRVGDYVRLDWVDEDGYDDYESPWMYGVTVDAIGRFAVIVAVQPASETGGRQLYDIDGLFTEDFDQAHCWGVAEDELVPATREEYEYQCCIDRLG